MKPFKTFACAALLALAGAGPVLAQAPAPPDPTHIPLVPPKDIPWHCNDNGECQAPLFGDPAKPGIYGLLIKWTPGHNSRPHSHSTERYAYVVSGTWWVSSSSVYDKSTMYPVPAGSYVRNLPNTVHWDGARDGETVIMMVGSGPMTTTRLPEK